MTGAYRPAEAYLQRVTEIMAAWAGHEIEEREAFGRVLDLLEEAGQVQFVFQERPANDA